MARPTVRSIAIDALLLALLNGLAFYGLFRLKWFPFLDLRQLLIQAVLTGISYAAIKSWRIRKDLKTTEH